MTKTERDDEIVAVRRGDRNATLILVAMLGVSFVLSSMTAHADMLRIRPDISWRHAWLNEGTSHAAILIGAAVIPIVINRSRLFGGENSAIAIGAHVIGFLVFTLIHVSIMYGMRSALFPAIIGYPYDLNVLSPSNYLYEARKDAFTYALIAFGFYTMRELERRRLEGRAAIAQARTEGRLSLKSGGESLRAAASEISYACAAGNYVDLTLIGGRTFLARMTLSRLERLLSEAQSDHIRIHRSHLVSRAHVRFIRPDGEGGLEIEMDDGRKLPGSRSRRSDLLGLLDDGEDLAGGIEGR